MSDGKNSKNNNSVLEKVHIPNSPFLKLHVYKDRLPIFIFELSRTSIAGPPSLHTIRTLKLWSWCRFVKAGAIHMFVKLGWINSQTEKRMPAAGISLKPHQPTSLSMIRSFHPYLIEQKPSSEHLSKLDNNTTPLYLLISREC